MVFFSLLPYTTIFDAITAASRGGRVRIPALPASANLPVCARAGRQGEFLGASVAAA